MYLAGVSVRQEITEALWENKVSPGTIDNLNEKIWTYRILAPRPLAENYSYVDVDGIY